MFSLSVVSLLRVYVLLRFWRTAHLSNSNTQNESICMVWEWWISLCKHKRALRQQCVKCTGNTKEIKPQHKIQECFINPRGEIILQQAAASRTCALFKELHGGEERSGGDKWRGEGRKTQPPDYTPWEVQCGATIQHRTQNINKRLLASHIKKQDISKAWDGGKPRELLCT